MTFQIREADMERDRAAMLSFIDGLQEFEFAIEPNRRLDATVAAEHFEVLRKRLAEYGGQIFIAEDGVPLGWAVVHETRDDIYIIEEERRMAYIDELYLVEAARGTGAGRALIEACIAWTKARGIAVLQIGVLPGNSRAQAIYAAAGFTPYALQLRQKF